jgi:hypothetical protein
MGLGLKTMKRWAFVAGTVLVGLSATACSMWHAQDDAQRINRAETIRCVHWNGRTRGTLLGQSATTEIRRILAEVAAPLRAATPLTQGHVLGRFTLEGLGGSTSVRVFSEPRWLEVEDRYYTLTAVELDALRQVLEPTGPNLQGREHERIP